MAIQAPSETSTDVPIPTLRSVYRDAKTAPYCVKKYFAHEKKLNSREVECLANRATHIVTERYCRTLGSAVLFYRKKLGDIEGYLYFGLVGNRAGFSSCQLDLVISNTHRIPIFLLNMTDRFDHEDILLFAFESNKKLDTVSLVKERQYICDEHYYLAGFQEDRQFDWDAAENELVDYYPISQSVQKFYARQLLLLPYQTYSYQNAFHGWSRQIEDFKCTENTLILHGMKFNSTMPGSIVVNQDGRVEGLIKTVVDHQFALVSDISAFIGQLKKYLGDVMKMHRPRQFRAG